MTNTFISNMTEDPTYQKTMMKVLSAPPALRAIANVGEVDAAFASDLSKKDLQSTKYGLSRDLAQEKLKTAQSYYDMKENVLENTQKNNERAYIGSGITGLANVGAGLYAASQTNKNAELMSSYLRKRFGL